MANQMNNAIRDRLAELERADRRRLMESTLKPLSVADASKEVESVSVPIDLLLGRLKDIERSIADVKRDLSVQERLTRVKTNWIQWILAVLILTTGVTLFWFARQSPALRTTTDELKGERHINPDFHGRGNNQSSY